MRTLVLDTATAACSVALIEDGVAIGARHEVVGRGHAERLVPMIAGLAHGGRADSILVDCGPGSFTGLRVGLAGGRALGLGWSVPVRGYSSMALLAAMACDDDRALTDIGVAIVGGHGELFVQCFDVGPLRARSSLRSLPPEAAGRAINSAIVVGSGAAALVAARGIGEARDLLPDAARAMLLPVALATLPPRPIYGRAPDAKPAA